MSIKKYVFAAFLGLGICTGHADVWGSQEPTAQKENRVDPKLPTDKYEGHSQPEEPEKAQYVCKSLIRDYIKECLKANNDGFGNVLAFPCKVKIGDESTEKQAVIVLINGVWVHPDYSQYKIPVYYISAQHVLDCVDTLGAGYLNVIKTQKSIFDHSKEDEKPKWEDRCEGFTTFYSTHFKDAQLMLSNYNEFVSNVFNQSHGKDKTHWNFWKASMHTEVQYSALKECSRLAAASNKKFEVKIDDEGKLIELLNVHNVKDLYSVYEPCSSCSELDLFTCAEDQKENFTFFAMDTYMLEQNYEQLPNEIKSLCKFKGGKMTNTLRYEITPEALWKNNSYTDSFPQYVQKYTQIYYSTK